MKTNGDSELGLVFMRGLCVADDTAWISCLMVDKLKKFREIIAKSKIMTRPTGQWFWVLTRPETFLPTLGDQASVFLQP